MARSQSRVVRRSRDTGGEQSSTFSLSRTDGRRYEAVLRLSEGLSLCQEPEDLTKILSEQLPEFLDFLQFYIVVYKENSSEVEWAVVGLEKSLVSAYAEVPIQQRPSWQAYTTQQPIHIRDWNTDERIPIRLKQGIAAQGLEIGPLVFVPLTTPHRRLGALGMSGRPGIIYSREDISFLRLVGRVVAFAIDDNLNLRRAEAANTELQRQNEQLLRRERELHETEIRFQAVADTAPVMIWTTGTDGLCNYFSKPWLDFTGRTMEQEVGLGWMQGVYPDDVQPCFDGFLPAFEARKPFSMEYRLKRADGEYRWVIESGVPRYNAGGEFAGYIGSNIDITDRKRAEEERERLYRLEADLARINRVSMMGELAASLAHEIKQPISAAVIDADTCLDWLARDQPDIGEARQSASRVIRDVKRASEIIARVRSLFNKGEPQRELIDVNEIAREMIGLLSSEAGRHAVRIQTELANDLPLIHADRVQLQQVLLNLVLNAIDAIKASNSPGTLKIKSQRNSDGTLLISVSDTGVGLPPGQKDEVFDAFFTTKSQGTGMGLTISRSIIESHGGRLWAKANAERGSTFHFVLPVDAKAA